VGKPEGKRPIGGPRRRREDNTKFDIGESDGVVRTGFSWLRIGTSGRCEQGNETLVSIKWGIVELLSD
jgi:hypothetical protein